jgi:hypothetical protein
MRSAAEPVHFFFHPAHFDEGVMQTTFHSAGGNAQRCCDFRFAGVSIEAQADDFAMSRRQGREHGAQQFGIGRLAAFGFLCGDRFKSAGGNLLLQGGQGQPSRKPTQRAVMLPKENDVKPGEEAAGAVETRKTFPRGNHRFLDEVLGKMVVAAKRQCLPHESRLQLFHELGESRKVSTARQGDEVGVVIGGGGGHAALHINAAPMRKGSEKLFEAGV